MTNDDDQSLGGGETIAGGPKQRDRGSQSLSDEATFAGGMRRGGPQSLGDEATFGGGGAGGDDTLHDDDMEIVDLAARYVTEGVLGKGGMGEVLLATDTRLERKVAIKRILGDAAKSRTAVSRFLTEAKSIAALNHPNIVQIYDYGRAADGPFLILEYVEGNSLLDRCRDGKLNLEEAVDLTCQLCDGLGKAHDAGIIHRDIKPANVLMTNDGVPKLTDFGLAKDEAADSGLSMAGAVLGTLDFMPPEQRKDVALTDSRSDLWSLAATLYQMVTGQSPKIIRFNNVPQSLHDVLGKALEDQKEDRYQTAKEFRDALKACLTAASTSRVPVVELGAGECSRCHTTNDANRKFCSSCATSLRVSCLQCSESIPVWDNVCGECGGIQSDLISARVAEYASQREQADQYLSDYQFESALKLARAVAAVEDERLAEHQPWAKSFITETETEWQRQQESSRQHVEEAHKHREAFDYQAAIDALEQVPEALRTNPMSVSLQQLKRDREESERLINTISDRVQRRDLDGLLEQVERAVELRGDRKDLPTLAQHLKDREEKLRQHRDEAFQQAEALLSAGDSKGAYRRIESVQTSALRDTDEELRERVAQMVADEEALTAMIKEANADGVLDPDEVVAIFQSASDYLTLNPHHEKITAMRQKLLKRILLAPEAYEKLPASVLSQLPASVLSQLPASVLLQFPPRKNSIGIEFKLLPAGTFTMGDNDNVDQVTLTKPFEIGVYEVTQEQYERVMHSNSSRFKGENRPVETVTFHEAAIFCRTLSELSAELKSGRRYRLPTEVEWEHACRSGTQATYNFGEDYISLSELDDADHEAGVRDRLFFEYGWCKENSNRQSHPVGLKKPNAWGLFDMHGNVAEWCTDSSADSPEAQPVRGGSWQSTAEECSSVSRTVLMPHLSRSMVGFRLVCDIN